MKSTLSLVVAAYALLTGTVAAVALENEQTHLNGVDQGRSYLQDLPPPDKVLEQSWGSIFNQESLVSEVAANTKGLIDYVRTLASAPALNPIAKSRIHQKKHDKYLRHDAFPNYGVRVRDPSKLGVDPDVKQYSGYLDVVDDDKHFFFWLFESRNDPETDPVVLWLNGGPGCSSTTGEFFELGPSFIDEDGNLVYNKDSWNANATVIFLDQPVNVGFSYSSKRVSNSVAAAEDVYSFLSILFEAFPEYNKGQDFHIAGESYAGHYIPAIGKAILDHEERGFNLSSLLIGNPIVDIRYQAEAAVAMACGEGGYPSLYDDETCTDLYRKVPQCEVLAQRCYDTNELVQCLGASFYCAQLETAYSESGRNPYDVSRTCDPEDGDCYPEQKAIEEWLNQDYVKEAVGADVDKFIGCSPQVGLDFSLTADGTHNFAPDLAYILDSGVPVLQMSGKLDWICNILGSRRFLPKMQWSGAFDFNKKYLKPWKLDGKTVGWSKSSDDLLTYLEIEGAGHMIPHDQPAVAKAMLDHWLAGNRVF